LTLTGAIPPKLWNKVATRMIPKLQSAQAEPHLGVNFDSESKGDQAAHLLSELQQAIVDLRLSGQVKLDLQVS
jgi:hypothetical protein